MIRSIAVARRGPRLAVLFAALFASVTQASAEPPPRPSFVAPQATPEPSEPAATSQGYGGLWVAGGGAVSLGVGFFAYRSAARKQDQLCTLTEDGTCGSRLLVGQEEEADALKSQMRIRELIGTAAIAAGIGLVTGGVIYHVVQVRKARRARSRSGLQVGAAPLPGGGGLVLVGRSDL